MGTVTARTCLNCNAALTSEELAGGWCEGCGKRLPLSFRAPGPAAPAESEAAGPELDGWDALTVLILILPGCGLGAEIGYILAHLLAGADVERWCVIGGLVGGLLGGTLGALCVFAPPGGRLAAVLLVLVGVVYAAPVFGGAVLTVGASVGASGRGLAIAVAVGLLVGGLYGAHVARSKEDAPDRPTGGE